MSAFWGFDFAQFMEKPPKKPRRPKRPAPECPHGKRLRRLVAALDDAEPDERGAGMALIDAGKAYCVATCGGCALTVGFSPPA